MNLSNSSDDIYFFKQNITMLFFFKNGHFWTISRFFSWYGFQNDKIANFSLVWHPGMLFSRLYCVMVGSLLVLQIETVQYKQLQVYSVELRQHSGVKWSLPIWIEWIQLYNWLPTFPQVWHHQLGWHTKPGQIKLMVSSDQHFRN